MKYLACAALAILITGMTVDSTSSSYGLPTLTIGFFALLGVWGTLEALIERVRRSL